MKRYDEALKDYTHAIALNPVSVESYFARAGIAHKLGDKDRECADLKEAANLGFERASAMYKNNCQ
jgi:tetratricopeptide (TPR) repeat protein